MLKDEEDGDMLAGVDGVLAHVGDTVILFSGATCSESLLLSDDSFPAALVRLF